MEGSESKVGPSTLSLNIADGSDTRGRTIHGEVDIMDGSESKAEPSTLGINIADGSMSMG